MVEATPKQNLFRPSQESISTVLSRGIHLPFQGSHGLRSGHEADRSFSATMENWQPNPAVFIGRLYVAA